MGFFRTTIIVTVAAGAAYYAGSNGYDLPSLPSNVTLPWETQAKAAQQTPKKKTAFYAAKNLPVKGRAPQTGYDRDLFGYAWKDMDKNGCDTRNDILKRDLTDITYQSGSDCVVQTGILNDKYSGKTINFVRGQSTSPAVQIDHRVPLSDAWQKGAQQWDTLKRENFANDPLNLIATDGPLNMSKGDGDAATWLPPKKNYRCKYVAYQTAVKKKYGVWVTSAERTAIVNILKNCPNMPLPKK